MRRAARVDATQAAIVAALRARGAYVWPIGLPVDLLVGFKGATALIECKVLEGKKAPRAADHTPLQKRFLAEWPGGTVATVTDEEGALRVLAMLESK
jgi:hypothetical protein